MASRKLLFRALAVVVMGGAAQLLPPRPAAATDCVFCPPQCPADVQSWCQNVWCYGFASCGIDWCQQDLQYETVVNCAQF